MINILGWIFYFWLYHFDHLNYWLFKRKLITKRKCPGNYYNFVKISINRYCFWTNLIIATTSTSLYLPPLTWAKVEGYVFPKQINDDQHESMWLNFKGKVELSFKKNCGVIIMSTYRLKSLAKRKLVYKYLM